MTMITMPTAKRGLLEGWDSSSFTQWVVWVRVFLQGLLVYNVKLISILAERCKVELVLLVVRD